MDSPLDAIKKIAVTGAGIMGAGVALDLACHEFDVILKDVDARALERAKIMIRNDFRMVQMLKKNAVPSSVEEVLSRIRFMDTYDGFEHADLVIENVTEDWGTKKSVYKELADICREDVYFGVNTSCIPITRVAALVPKPERVMGMHFMNPVPLKEMVEVVRGYHTSGETETHLTMFLKTMGKNPVVVNDAPGFAANRVSHLFMNEAAFLVHEGVAEPAQVDIIFKQGYGHKMGPLETADLIGLDTVVNSLGILYESYQDSKFRCCPLLKNMVHAGLLGRKSGKGFYEYT